MRVGVAMNLFLEARKLTDSREDMLTCFLAAGLDADEALRRRREAAATVRQFLTAYRERLRQSP